MPGRLAVTPLGTELLDDPAADPAAVARVAAQHRARQPLVRRRRRGAVRAGHGCCAACPAATPLTLLDLGTGAGRPPSRARSAGPRRAGIRAAAARPGAEPARGRAGAERRRALRGRLRRRAAARGQDRGHRAGEPGGPPFRPAASVVRLLRTCDALARRAVIVADLRRGRLAPLAFRVGSRLLGFDPVTMADGHDLHSARLHRRRAARLLARGGRSRARCTGGRDTAWSRPGGPVS